MKLFVRSAVTMVAVLLAGGVAGLAQARIADASVALEQACESAGGRYEAGWSWDVSGVAWGRYARCETTGVRIVCRDSICHAKRRDADRLATLVKDKSYSKHGVRVAARRSDFERVLRPVAMY